MFAAGIKTPVPLEELEGHLREEIEELVKSGMDQQKAFEAAVGQMAPAEALKKEFRRTDFLSRLGDGRQTRINRIFASLWLACLSWEGIYIAWQFSRLVFGDQHFLVSPGLFMAFFFEIIFLWGIVASIRILGGNYKGIRLREPEIEWFPPCPCGLEFCGCRNGMNGPWR